MSINEYDYLIVGHGLAGSVLAYLLIKDGKKVFVIDRYNPNSSSLVAAGLVNPVTGRRVVKTWMADTLLPFAKEFYSKIEKEFNADFYYSMDVLEVLHSVKELNEWTIRMEEDEMKKYLNQDSPEELYKDKIHEFKKMVRINSSAWLNVSLFTDLCREKLNESTLILEEPFDISKIKIEDDCISYPNIKSKRIIFCEGYHSFVNPLWDWLPFVPAKGELLTIKCDELPEEFILLSGIFLIPLGDHYFRVGATFEWDFEHESPTLEGRQKLLIQLKSFLKIPFEIIDHRAGVRPTVKDRRPFIGNHPKHKNVFIFNGLGTKGVLLAPYFGNHFVKVLKGEEALLETVNIARFSLNVQR